MYFYKRLLATICLAIFVVTITLTYHLSINNFSPFASEEKIFAEPLEILKQEIGSKESNGSAASRYQHRVDRVISLCKQFSLGTYSTSSSNELHIKDPPSPQYSYFFLDRDRKLAWCPVYKAGSTTWLHQMLLQQGFTEEFLQHPPQQLSIFARQVFPYAEPNASFDNAHKLLIVRHPFERLVSAYHDKLSNSKIGLEHGTAHYYEKYGRKIVKKFRTNESLTQIEPTFEEFVRYLLHTNLAHYADDHWIPAYLTCTPCRVHYDIIAKVETYEEDQILIAQMFQLDLHPLWHHRTNLEDTPLQNPVSSRAQKYFSSLTQNQVTELYQKYYLDFELFSYSYKPYLRYAKAS